MNDINIPLLRKAVEWVEYQDTLPEIDREWEQRDFVMGPMGRAHQLMFDLKQEGQPGFFRNHQALQQVAAHCGTAYCVAGYIGQLLDDRYAFDSAPDGYSVGAFAQEALGLTEEQADELFDGGNTAEMIRELAEKYAGQKL